VAMIAKHRGFRQLCLSLSQAQKYFLLLAS
jgi:hypothetical protein